MFSSLFRRARRTTVATLAIAPFVIGGLSPAMGACIQPQGVYVGSGAGPTSYFRSGTTPPSLSPGVMNITFYLDLSVRGKWNYRFVSKYAGYPTNPNFGIERIYQVYQGPASISRSPLDARPPERQGLDPTTCTGTLQITGFGNASSELPDIQQIPHGPISASYSMTVTQDGAVVTLTDYDYKSPFNLGFPIELRRQ